MARRTGFQAPEEPDRSEGAAWSRRTLRQNLVAGSPLGYPSARTACRRVRGLSPLGTCRLTRPGAWRMLVQLVATFLQAIAPQPSFEGIGLGKFRLRRHLHEPPRKRLY